MTAVEVREVTFRYRSGKGLGGVSFGGFNENVDARPVKWREFQMTP